MEVRYQLRYSPATGDSEPSAGTELAYRLPGGMSYRPGNSRSSALPGRREADDSPHDFSPYRLPVGVDIVPELVRERGDDGQAAPVLIIVRGIARAVPLARPGVGDLGSRPPRFGAHR